MGRSGLAALTGLTIVALLSAGLVFTGNPPVAADGNEAPGSPFAFRSITAGLLHTCAGVHSSAVKCWGSNSSGQLGLGAAGGDIGDVPGEMGDALTAVALGTARRATALTAGIEHTCARLDNATVKCWGDNGFGQLGIGDTGDRGDGGGEMGDNLPAVNLGTGRTATAIAAGGTHTCALLDNATVKCWGANADGQLGLGDNLPRGDAAGQMGDNLPTVNLGTGRTATAITAGSNHNCALLDNATVKCWGNNGFSGTLGLGDTADRGDGANEMGDNLPAVNLGTGRTATSITAGGSHNCALLDNATTKCWGENGEGQLGLGFTADMGDGGADMGDSLPAVNLGTGRTATAVTTGANHTCALLDSGALKCWGFNQSGQLGLGDDVSRGDSFQEMGNSLPALDLGGARTAVVVTAGGSHVCALLDNGTVRCWGDNASGQLGLGDTADRGDTTGEMGDALPTVDLGTGRTATAIAAGASHTCAVLDNGSVKCWGSNNGGQLGLGDTANRGDTTGEMGDALPTVNLGTGRTATAISAGTHTCAVLDNGTIKCWGGNLFGQLGLGDTASRGDGANEMGDNLPAVSLGTGRTATAVSLGAFHTCARLDNATVKCWGFNSSAGRLGLGDAANRGDGANEMGDNLPTVNLGTGRSATAIDAGSAHTCALLDNGAAKCWGSNTQGQLGQGDTTARGFTSGQMGDSLTAIDLGTGRTATAITAGDFHTCARLDNAKLRCWGDNANGGLGIGDTADRGDTAGEMGDALPFVALGSGRSAARLTVGSSTSCARLDDGSVKCWGLNDAGQLARGDVAARGDNASEMGDALVPVDLGSAAHTGMSGTVIDAVSAAPIPGASIAVLRAADFSLAAGVVADGSGNYEALVAPGSYYLYLIDPIGGHALGFSAGNPVRVVPADTIADIDPTMAPSRGAITGTITEDGTGNPVPGAMAIAISATTGVPETGVVADGSGGFNLSGLRAGPHYVVYIDPTGAHHIEFFPNSPTVDPGATPLTVSAGGNTVADDALAGQTPIAGGAAVTGTVTGLGPIDPLSNVFVIALRASDFAFARATVTNGAGQYSLDLLPGQYKLAFLDATGRHDMEWHDNQPNTGLGAATSVNAPSVTNARLDPNTGKLAGTVRDDPSNNPVFGAWVLAIGPTGITGTAVTTVTGTYLITGLPPGTHRATFVDPNGGRRQEFYPDATDFAGATPLNITANSTVSAIDGLIALP